MKHGNLIVEMRPVGPFAMNSYLVGCEQTGEAAVIDSGGDSATMLALAEKHGLTVKKLLQTHAHIDHIAGLGEMKRRTGAPIYLHPDDEPIYRTASMQAKMFGLRVDDPPPYDEKLADGDVVSVGELRFEVLHTPGHCPGLVCFHEPRAKVVFCGDLVFQGSIGRVDLPGASPAAMRASLTRFLEALEDEVVVYPGHMGSTTVGSERHSNPFLVGLAS